jgi:adenylate cyclase
MARLIISSPDLKKGILELNKAVTTVGRGHANDLVLNDPSISRFHAVFKVNGHGVLIADRGSTNGVVLNGRRISQESALNSGDIVRLGGYELRLEDANGNANGIRVRRGEWPSTLHENIRSRTPQPPGRSAEVAVGASPNLAGKVEQLERENYLLAVLYDAGKALNAKLSIEDISEQVVRLAFRIAGVERGFVMMFDESGQAQRQSQVQYRNPHASADQPHIILSRSVLERLRKERQPILIDDATADARFNFSDSLRISGIRSAMCAPLMGPDRLFGILYVDNMSKTSAFTQEELNVFAVVAAQAGAAIDNVVAHERIAQQALQRSALERFLAPEVAEMVVANPDIRLGGVNQKVTVMFADIRGFTPMSENLEPGRVVEILNEYFTRVTEVIFDCGGMLDKYIGDAVMAVFGAPISKGNDAAHAVQAAIHIQRLLIELNRDAEARQWPELRVGIGINTGIVTAGNIGSPRRLDYTVVGDTVNTASRLMSNAAGGQILVAHSTAAETNGAFDLTELPALRVKGRTEPVHLFSVNWQPESHAKKQRLDGGASEIS